MATIADNLSEIYQYKHDIKDAINEKGVFVDDEMGSYASAILRIPIETIYPTIDMHNVKLYGSQWSALPTAISNYNWYDISDLSMVFEGCSKVTGITIFNTNAQNMYRTFYGCSLLTSLDIDGYMGNVTSFNNCFNNCTNLVNLTLHALPAMNLTDWGIGNCTKLSHESLLNIINELPDVSGHREYTMIHEGGWAADPSEPSGRKWLWDPYDYLTDYNFPEGPYIASGTEWRSRGLSLVPTGTEGSYFIQRIDNGAYLGVTQIFDYFNLKVLSVLGYNNDAKVVFREHEPLTYQNLKSYRRYIRYTSGGKEKSFIYMSSVWQESNEAFFANYGTGVMQNLTCALGSINLSKLTSSEKAIASNKGWTLN